jgi:hypothetical protein
VQKKASFFGSWGLQAEFDAVCGPKVGRAKRLRKSGGAARSFLGRQGCRRSEMGSLGAEFYEVGEISEGEWR